MKFEIDFQLAEIRPGGFVTGRNCGVDAKVGTLFTAVYRRVFPLVSPGENIQDLSRDFVCHISLKLESIEVYGHRLDLLSSGLTALIGLSGPDLSIISKLISEAPTRTYYSLVA